MLKEKIKVQLDFNISKKTHSLYHSFFNNPPKGVEYFKSEFKGINKKTYSFLGKLRKKIIGVIPFFEKLDKFILSLLRKESDAELIHFTFHLGKTKKNCVIDYETAYTFIHGNNKQDKIEKEKTIKLLKKNNIKFLIPIHKEALKSFKLFFGKEINIPQEVVYPTIFIPEENRDSVEKKKKVIFISTANIFTEDIFLIKGGLETLKAFKILAKRYSDYEFVILGKIPEYLKKEIPENLILINRVSREEMWKLFNESQIFVQPCYQVPAMAFLEAMFFKLPIITADFWGNKEYVDKSNGIMIKSKEINYLDKNNVPSYSKNFLDKIKTNSNTNATKIVIAVEKLIQNPKLRKKLGENGFERVLNGKFSIEKRNKKLEKIYKQALS
jgi:glycosyltransferase involved in cell wall biosynthesis